MISLSGVGTDCWITEIIILKRIKLKYHVSNGNKKPTEPLNKTKCDANIIAVYEQNASRYPPPNIVTQPHIHKINLNIYLRISLDGM